MHTNKNSSGIGRPGWQLAKIVILLLLSWGAAAAQPSAIGEFPARLFPITSNDGLSQGFVPAIFQDHRGFIWFATKDGLNKYDGYKFTIYRHDPENSYSLSDNFVTDIAEDSHGYLWVSTASGLDVFDPVTENFCRLDYKPAGVQKFGVPRKMEEDGFGRLWFRVPEGNYVLTIHADSTKKARCFSDNHSVTLQEITDVIPVAREESPPGPYCIDQQGGVWLTAGDSLFFVSKQDMAVKKITRRFLQEAICGIPGAHVLDILNDAPRHSIVIISTKGVSVYNFNSGSTEQEVYMDIPNLYYTNADQLDEKGNAWLFLNSDFYVFNRAQHQLQKLIPDNSDSSTWANADVESVLIDRGGIVWMGTNGYGVFKYNPRVGSFHMVERHGIRTVNEDREGNIYLVYQDELYHFYPAEQKVRGKAFNEEKFALKMPDRVHFPAEFRETGDGIFWLNYGMGCIARYNVKTGELKRYQATLPDTTGINFATTTLLDNNGDPWITLEQGKKCFLLHFSPGTETFSSTMLPVTRTNFSYPFVSVTCTCNGDIWLGTLEGLFRYSPGKGSWTVYQNIPGNKNSLSNNMVFSLCPGQQENSRFLWIGTNSGGLNRLEVASGMFTRFTEKDGLPNNVVYGVLADESGNLWLSTNHGLCRFNMQTHECKNYFASDGLQGNEFNRYCYFKTSTGVLYFGGVNGINFFDPAELNDNEHVPLISLTGFRLFNSDINFRDSSAVIDRPIDFLDRVVLHYDQNVIAVEFAAMDYAATDKNQFKYKLEGFDKDWNFSGTRHEAIYTGLEPGEYDLVIMGTNSEGVWSKGRAIHFVVLPPWWKTWWARSLFFILGVSLIGLFILIRTASLRRSRTILEEKVRERTRELDESILYLKQTQKQLVKNEKLASFGQLTAGIAHEIKNPLNFINNFSELSTEMIDELKIAATDEERNEILKSLRNNLEKIHYHGMRVDTIIKSMLNHSRTSGAIKQQTDINKMCDEFGNLAYHSMRANVQDFSCALEKKLDASLPMMEVVPQDISRVLLNLLNNAFYAVNEKRKTAGADYRPSVTITTQREENTAVISIRDNGSGIPPEVMEKLFDPFFTTKPAGEGTGLGLSISYDIVHSHGGKIQVDSKPGEYTEFTIRLPLQQVKTPALKQD